MALTRELNELTRRLGTSAELACTGVMRDLERSVCGCDYGGTSGTTRREAEQIARLLSLRPGVRLLDVGAGSGWPGLYVAKLTGCDITLLDIPLPALRIARERAIADDLAARCTVVVADAAAMPLLDGSFDALSHSDLLCCTPDKLGVLRECRRVARGSAKMAFSVIALAPSLGEAERRAAIAAGPKFVDTPNDYAILLDQSAWAVTHRMDVTGELLQYLRAELHGMQARERALIELLGSDAFKERITRQEAMIAAIDARFLRRELFVASARLHPVMTPGRT